MKPGSFERFAGLCAILAAVAGLLYAISFVILKDPLFFSIFLMLGGLLSLGALVGLFNRLGEVSAEFSVLGLILGAAGALGAALHGAYDLANVLHAPPAGAAVLADLPSQLDPRGFLTFGAAGLSLIVAASMMGRGARFPRYLGPLTYLLAVLLMIVYLGRLIVVDPSSPLVLIPAALTGFIVNPLWYLLLGLALRRDEVGETSREQQMA
jgi:hypothetical protein